MQNWSNEMWLIAGIGLFVGFILAYLFISLTKGSVKKQTETAKELTHAKQELESQKQLLEKHFAESADLFKTLAQDYQKIYRHLAKSSEQLLPDANNKSLFLQSFMNSEKSTAITPENPPKDYKEGSSGLLKN
ncbi:MULTISPECIES: YhcB family protein [unclassified Lonepinella]|uniref:YhcB family protein n=1 Tax=unclassified Lonepinella TaxID=2642006 RepID=UPI0036DAAA31